MLLLGIDIGNTTVSLGVINGRKILGRYSIELKSSQKDFSVQLVRILKKVQKRYLPDTVAICSVVPERLKTIESLVKRHLKIKPLVIGRDVNVPIKNKYRHPHSVGQDRLVGAYAVKLLYGAPAIIIDFGTAITFDIVSAKGEYEGGMIVPGLQLSVESLFQKTAMLPKLEKIRSPRSFIGKTTQDSILNGLIYGYGTMCSGMIDLIKRKIRQRPKIIVTGGYTRLMRKYIAHKIDKIDPHLIFKGLYLINTQRF